jgi:ribosomal protein S18 acetylase RimI-like enzyme
MEIVRLPTDEAALRRYVESLWLPYHRELERTVDHRALADDVDNDRAVAFYEGLGFETYRRRMRLDPDAV